jgi:hypothetical protein
MHTQAQAQTQAQLAQAQAQAKRQRAEQIVLDHGHLAYVDEAGTLMGGILYSQRQADDSVVTGIEWTPVPLDLPALRDWLGY